MDADFQDSMKPKYSSSFTCVGLRSLSKSATKRLAGRNVWIKRYPEPLGLKQEDRF